jgi:hypothetical protein
MTGDPTVRSSYPVVLAVTQNSSSHDLKGLADVARELCYRTILYETVHGYSSLSMMFRHAVRALLESRVAGHCRGHSHTCRL